MTSLSRQLARLKDAPSSGQGIERDYSSLLFSKKEAASLDREQAYKLGLAGLAQLKKIDPTIDEWEPQLFAETSLDFNRSMITKEENEKITASLERMITVLAPYFHHQACKQVLEWLIYRYQIHNFDAEFLAIAFLPFHDMNSYGRLGSILMIKKNDWQWLKEVTKDGAPIPFNFITRQCLIAGGNMHLIGAVGNFLANLTKTFDEEYLTKNYQYYFLFFTKLIASLFEDPANATDQLISRIIPQLGLALKSNLLPFKIAGMILITQLSMTVTFTQETLFPIISLLLNKVKSSVFSIAMDTFIVICQHQSLEILPVKTIRKLIKRREELDLDNYFQKIQLEADLAGFLKPFWATLLHIYNQGVEDEDFSELIAIFDITTVATQLSSRQATDLMTLVIDNFNENANLKIPRTLQRNLKAVILRFGPEFDVLRSKYKKKNDREICLLIEQCQIQPHEIGELELEKRRKRRRRTSSTKSAEDVNTDESKIKKLDRHSVINKIAEPEQRKPFNESPLMILFKFSQNKWVDISFMLQSFKRPEYLKKFANDDIETFVIKVVTFVSTSKIPIKEEIKVALSHITLSPDFVFKLLSKPKPEPQPKKSKPVGVKAADPSFLGETDEQYQKRLLFVLETLNINKHYKADTRFFVFLFDLIEEVIEAKKDSDYDTYKLSLTISLFLKHVQQPDAAILLSNSLRLDAIVKVIRFTNDHNILRNALHILALLAPIIPGRVVTQIMSVFTFMGDGGTLKKDNELTMSVVEEALNALFTAITTSEKNDTVAAKRKIRQKLLEVSKIFAVSLIDIPAHRRMRILRAVGNTVASDDLWIFLGSIYDNFCIKWQKSTSKKNDVDIIHEITLEFIGEFEPEVQLMTAINLLDYIIGLGADHQSAADRLKTSNTKQNELIVFDRDSRSVQKLRYFRFLIFGWVLKFFNYKPLYEQLGTLDDEKLYERMLEVGKKLLITVTNVADFMENGLKAAENEQEKILQIKDASENDKNAAVQALRYWVALAAKADIICDRMRCLLPANVSGHIICDLLIDADDKQKGIEPHIRDRAMQLLNVKMIAQSGFDQSNDKGDIHTEYLMKFAKKLNEWITPAEKRDEITLCQNAAFSLKLVAKKIPPQDGQKVFTETMEKCVALLRDWASFDEAMIGNILLLIGELVRSQNLKSTVLYSEAICSNTIEILRDCEKKASEVIEQIEVEKQKEAAEAHQPTAANSRRKRSQLSLCGKNYGDDSLLLCAITCSQRLFDHSSKFITNFYEPFIHVVSQLSAKYMTNSDTVTSDEVNKSAVSSPRMDNIRLRLTFIRAAISKQEIRLLVGPFTNVSSKLMKRPLTLASLTCLIGDSIKYTKTDYITKVIEQLVEMFMILFKFRKSDKKVEKFEFYNQCEDSILTAFLALIDHLKADGLRPIVNSLVEHVKASLTDSSNTRLMAITVFNFANQFYDSYHNLAIPYFAQLFDLSIKILKSLNAAKVDAGELFINGTQSDTVSSLQANHLIILILKFINKCSRHTTFFTEDLVKACYPAVLDEIENTKVFGHEERCVPHLSNCIYSIAEASVDIFNREICNSLLSRTRHSSAKIRHRAVLIFEQLVDRIGDSLAPLLPLIVQYLSELLEDTNKKVTTQAEKTIRLLRDKFGSDVFGNE